MSCASPLTRRVFRPGIREGLIEQLKLTLTGRYVGKLSRQLLRTLRSKGVLFIIDH